MEEEKEKTKYNKKFLIFGVIGLFAIAVVSAGLVTNWFSQSSEFDVTNPISVDGETTFSDEVIGGDSVTGEDFTISNDGSVEVNVVVSDDSGEGITTSYSGVLELTKKNVNFSSDVWEVLGNKVNVRYTVVGDSFVTEVLDVLEGYSLIYYKDNSDRFSNPAQAILIGDVSGNLPYETDGNADEYDYCETGEYATCHGAKLWYVPTTAILGENEIDWSRASEFYFESSLIQYNSDGELVMYPDVELTLTPQYDFDVLLESGIYTVTTEVNPVA